MSLSFPTITRFEEIQLPPLANGEWGVLALDADQCLIEAQPTLADEHHYKFLVAQNAKAGTYAYGHYSWTTEIRKSVPYRSCESAEKVNAFMENAKAAGWFVVILTSRGLDMRDTTQKHFSQAELSISLDQVIFKERDTDGNLLTKDLSLINWMKGQDAFQTAEKIRILFADDSTSYCKEVQRVESAISHASVACYHYVGSLPNSELDKAQLSRLVHQLNVYQKGGGIPYEEPISSQTASAMTALEIKELTPQNVYQACKQVASQQGKPF